MSDVLRLTLDRDTHEYRVPWTRQTVSVTEVLQRVGYIDTTWFTDDAKIRGQLVHHAIATRLRGGGISNDAFVTEEGYTPGTSSRFAGTAHSNGWGGYVDAAYYWLDEHVVGIEEVELSLGDELFGLAGTLDAVVRLKAGAWAVVDWKTGGAAPWHRLQTSLYRYLALRHFVHAPRDAFERITVYLHADATYAAQPHPDHLRDERVGLAALTVARDQLSHRVRPLGDTSYAWD